jgi:hypothetical protein
LVRHGPAEQIIDRLLGRLAHDVPQRLLDAGRGAIEFERAAPLRVIVEGDLQEVPDLKRVAADQITAEFCDLGADGAIAIVLAIGLAPADDAGIGLDANEHEILAPAGIDRKAFDTRYFHEAFLLRFLRSAAPAAVSFNTNCPVADMARMKRSRPF